MTFDEAFEKTIGHEGGLSDDPQDRGGLTKYGISQRAYPSIDIKALTLDDAKLIYRRSYWDACQCGQLPAWIAGQVFDAAVNSGVKQASLWLQRAVGTQPDGIIGAQTIACARRADPGTAVARFNAHRLQAMTDMEGWAHFSKGWARRIASNLMDAG